MTDTSFQMSTHPSPITQIEGWPGTQPEFEASLAAWLGTRLPPQVGEILPVGSCSAVRIAPRKCWMIGAGDTAPALNPEIGCVLPLPDGRLRLRLSGHRVLDILSACLAVDWDAPHAAPGYAIQTGFQTVPVMALRIEPLVFDVLVPRTLARSLTDWLTDMASPWTQHP